MASNTISPSSPISSDPPASSPGMESIVSLTLPIAVKLSESNFLTWKSQILPLIHGYNLTKFLESPPPATTNRTSNGDIELNSDYLLWHRQDQLLLGWIRSSLTEPVLAQVVSSSSTRSLWNMLEDHYASTSKSRIHDLKRQIQTANKGTLSCSDYLLRLHRVADELAFIGSPISEEDLVTATINGLGTEFNSIVAALSTARCHRSFSFSDLHGLLLGHEALLQTQTDNAPAAFYTGRGNNNNNRTRYNTRPDAPAAPTSSNLGLSSQPTSNSTNPQFSDDRPTCQICTKFGHSAKLCYRRYTPDPDWKPNPWINSNAKALHTQVNQPPQDSLNWVIDSGANQHVTNDINNLSSFFAYKGPDKLQIGNGFGLPISHIDSSSFHCSNLSIRLNNVLHVPSFSTNLISLSQLLLDNPSLSIIFSSSFCTLKDLHIKTPPLHLTSFNGLYILKLKPFTPSIALLSNCITPKVWHARLGHPSTTTTMNVIKNNSLSCTKDNFIFCHDCIQAKAHVLPFSHSISTSTSPLQIVHSDV